MSGSEADCVLRHAVEALRAYLPPGSTFVLAGAGPNESFQIWCNLNSHELVAELLEEIAREYAKESKKL